jgi:glycosyltransferase involved in cell wall biosynthesis
MTKVLEVNVDDNGHGGVYSLVKNVIEHKPEGLHIDIACQEPFEKQANIDALNALGTQVYYVGRPGNKVIKQRHIYKQLKALMTKERYDYVHIHSDVANKIWVAAKAAKAAGIANIILHSHAAGVDGAHQAFKRKVHRFFRTKLKHYGTCFVACSDLARDWMYPNLDPSQVQLIHNGVDLKKFRYNAEVRTSIRNELDLQDAVVVGHVGRFAYQKNHGYLLKIFKAFKALEPRAKLLLVGEGELKAQTEAQAQAMGLKDAVIFYGASSRVPKLLQAMDIFVLPSHFEGLPIVGVEAQAAGLPVLFSDQITREAKLTEAVRYLPITEEKVPVWAKQMQKMSALPRQDAYDELNEAGYDIAYTVQQFLDLYTGGAH